MNSKPISPFLKTLLWFSFGFFAISILFFGFRTLNKGRLHNKISEYRKVTFLLTVIDEDEKLLMGAHFALFPQEKKCISAFFNPISRFEEDNKNLNQWKQNPTTYLAKQVEVITGSEPNYTIEIKESSLSRMVDIVGGITLFFDEYTLRSSDRYIRKNHLAKLPGDDVVDSIKSITNPNDPLEFVIRMEKQKGLFLTALDQIKDQETKFPKNWVEFIFSLTKTELSFTEFLSLINYLNSNSVSMAFMDVPGELTNDLQTKEPYLLIKNNVAAIAYKNFVREIHSELFGEGENARVEVLNTTQINGLAKRAKSYLNDKRIKVLSVETSRSFSLKETIILDRSGNTEYSRKISEVLGGRKIYHVLRKDLGLDSTILLGEDFRVTE